ncbi:hypothetical protein BH20CHL6_BH20CHL6_17560 [soil metagenome]
MPLIRVRSKGQMTLPDRIRRVALRKVTTSRFDAGRRHRAAAREGGRGLSSLFWDASWQEGKREASRDITEGRSHGFQSDEEFLESLD